MGNGSFYFIFILFCWTFWNKDQKWYPEKLYTYYLGKTMWKWEVPIKVWDRSQRRKNWVLEVIPESKICSKETNPSEYWELSQISILWTLNINPWTSNSFLWDLMVKKTSQNLFFWSWSLKTLIGTSHFNLMLNNVLSLSFVKWKDCVQVVI